MIQPIFIISQPRSGSTLLQRILLSHKKIKGVSEPWINLHFAYSLKDEGILSEYSHKKFRKAFNNFIQHLPNKEADVYRELEQFITNLYKKICTNEETYFLDKTPRYFYILNELQLIFPGAKFIFLVRNPLDVYTSIINTFSGNNLTLLYRYHFDIFQAYNTICDYWNKYKSNSILIQYEDLVNDTESVLQRIFEYLELNFDKNLLENFKDISFRGTYGDPTGEEKYQEISKSSISSWKSNITTPVRKRICTKILKICGEENLRLFGYNYESLKENVKISKFNFFLYFIDLFHYAKSKIIIRFKLNIIWGKSNKNSDKTFFD